MLPGSRDRNLISNPVWAIILSDELEWNLSIFSPRPVGHKFLYGIEQRRYHSRDQNTASSNSSDFWSYVDGCFSVICVIIKLWWISSHSMTYGLYLLHFSVERWKNLPLPKRHYSIAFDWSQVSWTTWIFCGSRSESRLRNNQISVTIFVPVTFNIWYL